ncbi:TetR/AcrR family transcriptional regulator [Microbacterium trichothecenolyticum]|uniref:HTH-type transcriptional regulator BetI n=1 Tax=Microbacterium trichothecenolyticum TaxID=69370 RepID=A0A0M2H709_MICTR|nr:TetR/AcrR family transcriptional regulator [Microbacterium trichothecenolyticum]KJL42309.1 HTH-type transcriptional regulator BetI [Microbacterium trichothecenolyticum]
MQKPNGHQVRSDKSTKALLRAAGELIAEGGYQSMTLAQVGERAGYSRSLATARFGSKGKLLEALVDEIVVRWSLERVEPESRGLDGLSALRVLLTAITQSYERNPRSLTTLYALIFEALGPIPELHERFVVFNRRLRNRIASTIEQGVQDGSVVAGTDPDLVANEIVAQLRGVGYLWQLDPASIDAASVLTQFTERCIRTLNAASAD